METDITKQETKEKKIDPLKKDTGRVEFEKKKPFGRNKDSRGGGRMKRDRGKRKSEIDKKVLSIRRVVRVAAGGRRFTFSAAVVVGNRKGKVAVALGKGSDVSLAIDKAVNKAKKKLVTITLTKDFGIPHEVLGKFCSSKVSLRPAQGIIAGGALRSVAELLGIKNVNAKILSRSKCHFNNAHATIVALQKINSKAVK